MMIRETPLAGAYIVEIDRLQDDRGFFARTFCTEEFAACGLNFRMTQCSVSFNARKGTLRGLHFQSPPHEESKLVRCTAGAIFDVIVDIRPESSTFRRWFGTDLTAANRRSLLIPHGFAHGFISTSDDAEVFYTISVPYAQAFARGIRWDDPSVGIQWPLIPTLVSARDAGLPLLDGDTLR